MASRKAQRFTPPAWSELIRGIGFALVDESACKAENAGNANGDDNPFCGDVSAHAIGKRQPRTDNRRLKRMGLRRKQLVGLFPIRNELHRVHLCAFVLPSSSRVMRRSCSLCSTFTRA